MMGQITSPRESSSQLVNMCRHYHYCVLEWLNDLKSAGDGSWGTVHEDSSELVVVGDTIDPCVINDVTRGMFDNEVVSCYADHGLAVIVIELEECIHNALSRCEQTAFFLQIDECNTKERVGLA